MVCCRSRSGLSVSHPETSPGYSPGGSLPCFHVSRRVSRQAGSCVTRLGLLGRRAPTLGMPKERGRCCPALARWMVCSYAWAQARLRTFESTPGTGHTREANLPGPDRRPETPSRGRAGWARCHKGTYASATLEAYACTAHNHDNTARVWCYVWELQSGCRPYLQRCASNGR